jgi:hypothetical protein
MIRRAQTPPMQVSHPLTSRSVTSDPWDELPRTHGCPICKRTHIPAVGIIQHGQQTTTHPFNGVALLESVGPNNTLRVNKHACLIQLVQRLRLFYPLSSIPCFPVIIVQRTVPAVTPLLSPSPARPLAVPSDVPIFRHRAEPFCQIPGSRYLLKRCCRCQHPSCHRGGVYKEDAGHLELVGFPSPSSDPRQSNDSVYQVPN